MAAQGSSISVQQTRFAISARRTPHCRPRHEEYGSICDHAGWNIGGCRSSPLVPIRQGSLRLEFRGNPAVVSNPFFNNHDFCLVPPKQIAEAMTHALHRAVVQGPASSPDE